MRPRSGEFGRRLTFLWAIVSACRPSPTASPAPDSSATQSAADESDSDSPESTSDATIEMDGTRIGGVGKMQPRRPPLPGFVLPGATGPKPCEVDNCDIEDPFPNSGHEPPR